MSILTSPAQDHSGFCAQELMMTLAAVYNFGVICCDMPGMGRSDGKSRPVQPRLARLECNCSHHPNRVLGLRSAYHRIEKQLTHMTTRVLEMCKSHTLTLASHTTPVSLSCLPSWTWHAVGLFMYVPDFSQFVDQAVEFLEVWVPEYVRYASYLLEVTDGAPG